MLRYIGLFATTMLPALYVIIASYNPEILRVGTRIIHCR
ncbi:hypothetical protein [Aneurinibacillus sp. Ricciae_BoGa-3]